MPWIAAQSSAGQSSHGCVHCAAILNRKTRLAIVEVYSVGKDAMVPNLPIVVNAVLMFIQYRIKHHVVFPSPLSPYSYLSHFIL